MQINETAQKDLKRWLLGLLPQEESQTLEEQLITDAALYEELHVVEDELIDDYIAGRLTNDEREAFESYFMNSPERQEQFRIANALRVYIDNSKQDVSLPHESSFTTPKPAVHPWAPFRKTIATVSMAMAALVVIVFVWWGLSLRSPSSGKPLSVILTPGGQTREGGSVQTVRVPPDVEILQLQLKLGRNDFQKYRATMVDSDGNVVQTSENLTPPTDVAGPTIQFSIRTSQIRPGEYQLKLDGVEDGKFESADGYRFIVITP